MAITSTQQLKIIASITTTKNTLSTENTIITCTSDTTSKIISNEKKVQTSTNSTTYNSSVEINTSKTQKPSATTKSSGITLSSILNFNLPTTNLIANTSFLNIFHSTTYMPKNNTKYSILSPPLKLEVKIDVSLINYSIQCRVTCVNQCNLTTNTVVWYLNSSILEFSTFQPLTVITSERFSILSRKSLLIALNSEV